MQKRLIESGQIRRKKGFTQVQNTVARDGNLSLKAKGLYLVIQSFITLPNSTWYKKNFEKYCSEGSTAFETAWQELKSNGYLRVSFYPKAEGKGFNHVFDLLDEPGDPILQKIYYQANGTLSEKTKERILAANPNFDFQSFENQGIDFQEFDNQGVECQNSDSQTSDNPAKNYKTSKHSKTADIKTYIDKNNFFSNQELDNLFKDFLYMVLEIKEKLAVVTIHSKVKKLRELSGDVDSVAIEILNYSIGRSYDDLYPIKKKDASTSDGKTCRLQDDITKANKALSGGGIY